MMQRLLIFITGAFLLLGAAAIATLYFTTPITLRVAVSADGEDARIMSTVATQLVRDRSPFRLDIVARQNPTDAAVALDAGTLECRATAARS